MGQARSLAVCLLCHGHSGRRSDTRATWNSFLDIQPGMRVAGSETSVLGLGSLAWLPWPLFESESSPSPEGPWPYLLALTLAPSRALASPKSKAENKVVRLV